MVVVCLLNARSLVAPNRLSQVKYLVSSANVDFLCVFESWLKPKHLNSTLHIPGFQPPFRLDRVQQRRGVAIYASDGIPVRLQTISVTSTNFECLVVTANLPRRKKLIITAYKPPSQSMDEFLDNLEIVVSSVRIFPQSECCLVGDFNAKHAVWYPPQGSDPAGLLLKEFTDNHKLHQLITAVPTHNVDSASPALLDLIFTSNPTSVTTAEVLQPIADHCPVVAYFSLKKLPPPKPFFQTYFSYADTLHHLLLSADWNQLKDMDLDNGVDHWSAIFMDACRVALPRRRCKINPSSKPWFSSYLKYLGRCRDRLFRCSRGLRSTSRTMITYRKVRNLFVCEICAAERRYFATLDQRLTASATPQQWWKLARRACGWSTRTGLPTLSVNNTLVTDPLGKACALNSHFQVQCSASPAAVPLDLSTGPRSTASEVFQFDCVSSSDVYKGLCSVISGKSSGIDGITNELLRLSAGGICDSLADIFNRSLLDGVFPDSWKRALVCPVLKERKDSSLPSSYHPIPLLSCVSKIFEQMVYDQLCSFCLSRGIIPDEQFGFLKGHSAEWQLLSVLEDWHCALDKGKCVHAVFLDAAKAFDRVDHAILLQQLASIGVQGTALSWFHSYLSDRSVRTKVMGATSNSLRSHPVFLIAQS